MTFGNGVVQAFTFDPVSRLASLTNDLSGTTNDLSATFAYNPASQIISTVRTGDVYAWTGHGNGSTAFTQNGLNQQITVGGAAATWDTKGNLTSEPQSGKTYGYSSENLLTSATGGVTLGYDPALRLYQVAGAATTRFAYDGANAIAEYNGSNALQRRYVFGPGVDEPIVQYEGTGTTDRRFMSADERGSIISLTDTSGALLNLNRYDEYGKPQSTNAGRFQYTGQMWLSELGAYYYKARVYLPHLGIFPQTDPIGYDGDGPNLYAYVLNDPVNLVDPLGLTACDENTTVCGHCTGSTVAVSDPATSAGIRCVALSFYTSNQFKLRPVSRVGGGGGGRGRTLRLRVLERKGLHEIPCSQALAEPGLIFAVAGDLTFVNGGGGTLHGGFFENLQTGTVGAFLSGGLAGGAEVAGGAQGILYKSARNFFGWSFTVSAAVAGIQGSLSFSSPNIFNGDLIGGSFGGAIGEGVNYSATNAIPLICLQR